MKEKQVVQEAFSELSPRYEESMDNELNLFWGWSYKSFLEELISRTDIKENQIVLDIATGTSYIPRRFMQLNTPGIKIFAQDISESMLKQAQRKIASEKYQDSIDLACSDALALPFNEHTFDLVVTGLSSHHIGISPMLSEMNRVLKPDGVISLIDVGTSALWEHPIMIFVARIIAFLVFLIRENPRRAWAEALAMSNLRTPDGWEQDLKKAVFKNIKIVKLPSKYKWVPEPLYIQAQKNGRNDDGF